MRTLLLLFFILVSLQLKGQLALVNEAQKFIQEGKLTEAKEIIDNASNEDAFKTNPRANYLKAFLYKDLYLNSKGASKESYRKTAFQTIEDAKPISSGTSFENPLSQLSEFMSSTFFNDGVDYFNQADYDKAIIYFDKFLIALGDRVDEFVLDATYYSGVSNYLLGNRDDALKNYTFVYENGYENPLLYNDLAALYLKNNNPNEALRYVKEGLSKFPMNQELLITELNILSQKEDYASSEQKVDAYISNYPDDIEVLLLAGTIYEKNTIEAEGERKTRLIEKSEKVYKKAVSVDPNNYHANYNLGVTLYNKGVDIINSKSYDLDLEELRSVVDKSNDLFSSSLPFLEKSLESRQSDIDLLKALRSIYYNLNMKDKFDKVDAQITSLE
ncbi:MAG: hypothetical protein AAF363_21740 [Bacteroidota bacterium]